MSCPLKLPELLYAYVFSVTKCWLIMRSLVNMYFVQRRMTERSTVCKLLYRRVIESPSLQKVIFYLAYDELVKPLIESSSAA